MKERLLKWVKERAFLLVIIVVYPILAFINLGNSEAPQTFYTFSPGENILIRIPEQKKVSSVFFYTGITENDFKSTYRINTTPDCGCENPHNNSVSINPEEFSESKILDVEGPFTWKKLQINQAVSAILIQPSGQREISYGELGVLDENLEKIDGIQVYKIYRNENFSTEKIEVLTDESSLIPKETTAMNSMIFDELYFAQTAYQYANGLKGYETVHPPLGKILQSIPIFITGKMTPLTWRLMGTIVGILIIVAVYYLALELFKKKYFANIAIVLISLSCLHFVQTRVGTVDSYLCLFTILSYLFMFKFVNSPKKKLYFMLSGVFFGCAVSVKWSGMFGGFGLAIIFFYNLFKKTKFEFKKFCPWLLRGTLWFIIVPLVIYCSSYLLFPKTTEAHSLSDIYRQGENLFTYHANENTPHSASAPWYMWTIGLNNFLFYTSEDSTKSISLFGNYVLCYISLIGLLVTGYFALKKRDKTSIYILIAYLSLLIPYAFITRPMFLYHYLSASVFAILAVVNMAKNFPEQKFLVKIIIISTLISFVVLYPKMTGI